MAPHHAAAVDGAAAGNPGRSWPEESMPDTNGNRDKLEEKRQALRDAIIRAAVGLSESGDRQQREAQRRDFDALRADLDRIEFALELFPREPALAGPGI